ncbi:sulfurtransferase [Verticiella sediminum]|uniref:Sulfurtransferase n=1 Tax=Verticiella sediminum TaxID=1247510 RepID=A0A556ACW7_9BURK|nr:rhodanese-like domain-containing protein [Verticiella sediminum]TSH90720.1 sulfurtransferase [Verticiella sediminum]
MSDTPTLTPQALAAWLADGDEIALIDVREEGLYGAGHPLLAVNLPYSRLETAVDARVPHRATRIVLIGDEPPVAPEPTGTLAARRLAALGYANVHVLAGGAPAWQAAGHPLLPSIHVPSKAFAEVVEHAYHTPATSAEELQALRARGEDVVVLDGRTAEEFARYHVPGAVSCPNAELVLRFADLVPSPKTRVVVSCAGRTRGIIGAQALINAGVPNPVSALAGGTQGWKLAGLAVEQGAGAPGVPASEAGLALGRRRARDVARRYGVPRIDAATLTAWREDTGRTTYVFDVRSPQEYAHGHLPGVVGVPGGQLVQTLDRWAAVRGARIVLVDELGARADITAHWLLQLGWEVAVLDEPGIEQAFTEAFTAGGPAGGPDDAQRRDPAPDLPAAVPLAEAADLLRCGAAAVSVAGSADFARVRATGAVWTNRSRLALLPEPIRQAPVLLVFGPAGQAHRLAALDLRERHPGQTVLPVDGTPDDWRAAGLLLDTTPAPVPQTDRIDFLFWLHDRHTGNADASRAYLAWEGELPAAIGAPEQAGFRIQAAA